MALQGQYNATALTLSDSNTEMLQLDSSGNLKIVDYRDYDANPMSVILSSSSSSTYAASVDQSTALEASSISKASAGNFYQAFGVIDSTATTDTYYVQILDSATLPADGAVTHLVTPVPVEHTNGTESTFNIQPELPVAASSGIVIVLSTTLVTKTIVGSNWLFSTVEYK